MPRAVTGAAEITLGAAFGHRCLHYMYMYIHGCAVLLSLVCLFDLFFYLFFFFRKLYAINIQSQKVQGKGK